MFIMTLVRLASCLILGLIVVTGSLLCITTPNTSHLNLNCPPSLRTHANNRWRYCCIAFTTMEWSSLSYSSQTLLQIFDVSNSTTIDLLLKYTQYTYVSSNQLVKFSGNKTGGMKLGVLSLTQLFSFARRVWIERFCERFRLSKRFLYIIH